MVVPHRSPIATTLILLLLQTFLEAKPKLLCPIGFQLAYTITKGDPICYRLKGPETLGDMYRECAGNLYNIELYKDLNISNTELVLWTEYKTAYLDGPFIDWSFTESTGKLLETKNMDVISTSTHEFVDYCVVLNPEGNYESRECDGGGGYFRYCFVKPYQKEREMSQEGCEDLTDSVRLSSPTPTCLAVLKGTGGGSVRATWSQAERMCKNKGGTLLNRGWRYSNIPWLHVSEALEYPEYPLGVVYNPNHTLTNADGGTIPFTEWNFAESFPSETSYGVVSNGLWHLVNNTHIFFDVICEKPVTLKVVNLHLKIDDGNALTLLTNETIDKKSISCFTDSEKFYPTNVKIIRQNKTKFILKPIDDGYYWCIVTNSLNYIPTESNRALFIRVEESLHRWYAVKIALDKDIKDIIKVDDWKTKLQEYIYYYNIYTELHGDLDQNLDFESKERILKEFKGTLELDVKEKEIILDSKLKQVSRDWSKILVHIELKPQIKPVPPGIWKNITVIFMKPTYYCTRKGRSFHDSLTIDCETYKCSGSFNEGMNDLIIKRQSCTTSTMQPIMRNHQEFENVMPTAMVLANNFENKSDSSEETTEREPKPTKPAPVTTTDLPPTASPEPTEVITVNTPTRPPVQTPPTTPPTIPPTAPPTTPPPTTTDAPTTTYSPTTERPKPQPEEQLLQVMEDLETLLNNDTVVVSVENISGTFDQVDELLEMNVDLDIPGTLLHLLDGIGARIDLNGSGKATAIRSNIALLVADAEPDLPVRGLRIAARDNDMFTEDAFEIIRQDVNASHLNSDKSEVVVQLPESVGLSSRRISFVVFRNDRAFQSSHYAVNSRVLSVNVQNLTQFERNEVVDIHFTPFTGDPNRNESRTCAFWQFLEGGNGYWSQEGCTFIESTEPGTLDTCRCNHLTHFAEILIPRAVFSENNEIALELLTVIGCCLSIVGLVIVGLTALLFRSWRRDFSNKIWLQLCVSIFLLVLCFLIVVLAKFDTYNIPCMLIGVALHYSVLASFCWMLVAAVLSYRRLVLVFNRDASHKLLKAAAFAWGAPFAVVGILLSVDPHSYAGRFEEKSPTGAFCYPSGLALWFAVFAPIITMLIANWTLFVLIVRSVFASRRVQRHGDSHNEALRCASVSCLLVFLFGLPWVFGAFSFNVVAAYFFTLTATYQGFILFLFFVLGNKKTRDLWLNKLKIKQTRKVPVTSSTYTNRSTGTSGRPIGPASSEGKVQKPRSLAASDDSRFS